MDKWKIQINDDFATRRKNVFIYISMPDGSEDMLSSDGVTIKRYKRGEPVKPTMQVEAEILQALFETLSKSGMKLPEESYTRGKLDATEKHLEDMRKITFKRISEQDVN